ncbi:MAG: hypothetical protein HY651_09110 [Acidobacteria bacterium]|nr:hypothetical protein [Acidobacteriota bacterium]
MHKICKKILRDESQRPVAVQIDYADWIEIEQRLDLRTVEARSTDLSRYDGVIALTEEPLGYQARLRQEWS